LTDTANILLPGRDVVKTDLTEAISGKKKHDLPTHRHNLFFWQYNRTGGDRAKPLI
jgi:hypothetical protein